MSTVKDLSELLDIDETADAIATEREAVPAAYQLPGVLTARLYAFDDDDTPLLAGVPSLPGEIIRARTTVVLLHTHIGSDVVVLFERGEARQPIVLGVVHGRPTTGQFRAPATQHLNVQADNERVIIEAEREVVLRCGDAAITLTRAGKVIIKGRYVVSRSTGYNKIKGAAVDIN